MKPWLSIAALVILAGFCGGAEAAKMILVEKGVSRAPIIVAKDAPSATTRAAGELADYVQKISGARPAVVIGEPDPLPDHAIWVGFQPKVAALFPRVSFDFQHPEEILMACDKRHLVIAGRDRMAGTNQTEFGTANAVYTFLQKYLEVRWFWPGPLGEDVLRKETVTLPAFEYRFHPTWRLRTFARGSVGWKADPLVADWFRFQRMELGSARFSAGHSFMDWWAKYHETHPEWFALRGNEGRTPEKWGTNTNPEAVKLCISNPEVAEQWLRNAEELLRRDPSATMIGATPNDGGGFCTCTNCRAWDNTNGPPVWGYVALTDRYVKFWNILARKLKQRFPDRDVCVGAYAYSAYSTPPVAERLEKNITMAYVGCFPLESEANREKQKNDWKRWAESASMMWYRPNLWYWAGGVWGFPEVAMKKTFEDFRFLTENHCVGLEVDGYRGYWATQGPQYYAMAQAAYDPFLDGAALMKDYYRRAFGPAMSEMEQYWTMMEEARDAIVSSPDFKTGSQNRYGLPPIFKAVYNEAFLSRADDLLRRAVAKTKDAPGAYGGRVEFVRFGFDYTRRVVQTIPLMTRARESGGKDTAAVRQAVENWAAIERGIDQIGVLALNWYGHLTLWVTGEGYMGLMKDHLGPPSEALRKAAYSGTAPLPNARGQE